MDHALSEPLLIAISGFGVGALVGMTGMGGGALMTPLLILLFGVHPATAVGTDLLYAAITKTGGTAIHGFHGRVEWRIVGRLAAGSLPATLFTLLALQHLDVDSPTTRILITGAVGAALLLTAVLLVLRGRLLVVYTRIVGRISARRTLVFTVATGAVLGVMVSISSVGAGAIGLTALVLLYPRLPAARIVGSDIAHAVPLTLVAGLGHWALGSVDWGLLAQLLIGSIPGILIGSYAAGRIPDATLRAALAVVLALVGGRLLL